MAEKRPTISEVAQEAGVSKATVSAVLNDKGTVNQSTRDRVLEVIERLNYRPSSLARRTGADRAKSIGLLIKETHNPFYADIITSARRRAQADGYTLLVASSEGEYESERRIFELLRAKDVDGMLVNPVFDEHTDLSPLFELKRRNFPLVLLEEIRGVPATLVDIDNVDATHRATKHLLDLGHVHIAHFMGPRYSIHSEQRAAGMRRAYSESSLIFRDELLIPAGSRLEDGYRSGKEFFGSISAADRPTAVICFNDLVAIGLMRALRELGLSVPGDISIVGHDDIDLLAYLPLGLTTIHVPKRDMAEVATELLIRHIESREALMPRRVLVHAELVVRESTRSLARGTPDTSRHRGPRGRRGRASGQRQDPYLGALPLQV
jgi:LacI family transcriptional regulator/LacI family repressor for deo operon, udp, cdd, tsx, nupC, and nupG